MHSDEASMVNGSGSNGDCTLPIVTPQPVKELEMGFVPQTQTQAVIALYGD